MAMKKGKAKAKNPSGRFCPDLSEQVNVRTNTDFINRVGEIGRKNNLKEAETVRFLMEASLHIAEDPKLGMPEIMRLRAKFFARVGLSKNH